MFGKKSSTEVFASVELWRRARDSNPRSRFSDLHDFQSCSFDQLGQLSISQQAIFYYISLEKSSLFQKFSEYFFSFYRKSTRQSIECYLITFLACLKLQAEFIRNHGDELGIGRFTSRRLNCITEIGVQNLNISPIPCNLNGMANCSFNTRRCG